MGLSVTAISPLFFAQMTLSVLVTLEGGRRGIAEKEIILGSTTILQCSLSSTAIGGTPALEWMYSQDKDAEGSHLYLENKVVEKYEGKVSWKAPFSLEIKDVKFTDAGYYRCRGILADDVPSIDSSKYHVTVVAPPYQEISCGFPNNSVITSGKSAEFHCGEVVPQANPPASFSWFKNGVVLPMSSKLNQSFSNSNFSYNTTSGILKFEKVVDEDAGEYFCSASNRIGQSHCNSTQISVITPPYEVSCIFPSGLKMKIGENATFQCAEVVQQAKPTPSIKWFKNGNELPLVVNSGFPNSNFSYDAASGTLMFEKVVRQDAGIYYCTVTNMAGSAQCAAAQISTSGGIALKAEGLVFLLVGFLLAFQP